MSAVMSGIVQERGRPAAFAWVSLVTPQGPVRVAQADAQGQWAYRVPTSLRAQTLEFVGAAASGATGMSAARVATGGRLAIVVESGSSAHPCEAGGP